MSVSGIGPRGLMPGERLHHPCPANQASPTKGMAISDCGGSPVDAYPVLGRFPTSMVSAVAAPPPAHGAVTSSVPLVRAVVLDSTQWVNRLVSLQDQSSPGEILAVQALASYTSAQAKVVGMSS